MSTWEDGRYHRCLKMWLRLIQAWCKQRGLEKNIRHTISVVMKSGVMGIYTKVPKGAPDLSTHHRAIQLASHWAGFSCARVGFQWHNKHGLPWKNAEPTCPVQMQILEAGSNGKKCLCSKNSILPSVPISGWF